MGEEFNSYCQLTYVACHLPVGIGMSHCQGMDEFLFFLYFPFLACITFSRALAKFGMGNLNFTSEQGC